MQKMIQKGMMVVTESWLFFFPPNPNKRQRVPLSIMELTAAQKPQVFFPEIPGKPQLAEHLLTKNQDNGAPLHLSYST